MPVRHIEPLQPIYDLRQSAIHGWHTLSRIIMEGPAVTDVHFQDIYSKNLFERLGYSAREITRAIEQQSPDAFFIPVTDLDFFRSSARYIRAIADAYYDKGTDLRIHYRPDTIGTPHVRAIFSKRANLADRAAGRECAHILNEFVLRLDRMRLDPGYDASEIAAQNPAEQNKHAPILLASRRPKREP